MLAVFPIIVFFFGATPALAAESAHGFDGSLLGLVWITPFVGILLSIALFPLLFAGFWHNHYGKVSFFWAIAFLIPFAMEFGVSTSIDELLHTLLLEYVPFIILIGCLFTIAGGIFVGGNIHGSPLMNTIMLATGAVIASVVGTTGASMILIRPLLRANDNRKYRVHTVVFFIFLVSNIGGSLTPLGDPPLFLGFLKGVDFFWPTVWMFLPMVVVASILLAAFYLLDSYLFSKEEQRPFDPTPDRPIYVTGLQNFILLFALIGAVLMSGTFDFGVVHVRNFEVGVVGILRDVILISLALVSLKITSSQIREANSFNWEPVLEVAKLFGGIFITIIPAIAILKAGEAGVMAPLLQLVTNVDGSPNNVMYFWLTGILSSFLDNAPTYLIFFNSAGGDAGVLQGSLANTLLAISAGAVFMGANTYIGNAPNFMVRSIAERHGVPMPSFFGYMGWSTLFLLPVFALVTYLFFV
ncbi:MAG: sodium:proton antiporter [Hyphomicrobiales bacterium]|nr:sodium:proton antiporter [Hyphomicrobiales bacterium]